MWIIGFITDKKLCHSNAKMMESCGTVFILKSNVRVYPKRNWFTDNHWNWNLSILRT